MDLLGNLDHDDDGARRELNYLANLLEERPLFPVLVFRQYLDFFLEGIVLLRAFLGREPSIEPFLREIGL